MTAATYRGEPRRRVTRLAKTAKAADAIGELTAGMEVFVLTFGQFSLIDGLEHLVASTGPADVVVSTWTAAAADSERARLLLDHHHVTRFRLIVDHSFVRRQPAYCARVIELFGPAKMGVWR